VPAPRGFSFWWLAGRPVGVSTALAAWHIVTPMDSRTSRRRRLTTSRSKGILAGAAAVAFLALIVVGVGYLVSDEKGLPVPTTVAGQRCWLTTKGIDVLDCRSSEQGENFFVRWKGRWGLVGACQVVAQVLRCRLPYSLRIDLRGGYPTVTSG
jgi:hypothetical protein